jgi:anti-sigma B factor antagonist
MPDHMFPVAVAGGVPVVATPEEIDITNAEALRSALLTAAASGHGAVVVDMTRSQFRDSSGLHTLLAARKRAEAEGREVLLVMGGPAVLRVFTLTRHGPRDPQLHHPGRSPGAHGLPRRATPARLGAGDRPGAGHSSGCARANAMRRA